MGRTRKPATGAVFTREDAEAAGWEINEEDRSATRGDQVIAVESDTPLFALLVNIAELEGRGFAAGYGGTQTIDAALVSATSGETLP